MARDRSKLGDAEVQAFLQRAPGWALEGGMLKKTFAFADFRAAMSFVSRVADAAEAADHHPDIDIRYSKVTLALVTHDAGGLTARDTALAAQVDRFA
ncbi:MAG TPA: 4a-hydroxytetrahydrobiopterin dehydratase [Myxococcaceae bacterium]|jgi:4a-hydroxytetrahydrobiopterin dehydratase|nr:4a-hydroxytetrahydrobiopterin dehydratase [Myxococcaceae bacterium]